MICRGVVAILVLGVLSVFCNGHSVPNVIERMDDAHIHSYDDQVLSDMCDEVAEVFEIEYRSFLNTGVESRALKELSLRLKNSHSIDIRRAEVENLSLKDKIFLCTACRSTVNVLVRMVRNGELDGPEGDALVKNITLDVCDRLDLQTAEVCGNLYESNWPIIKYIMLESNLTSKSVCGTFLEASFCAVTEPELNWTIDLDQHGPEINEAKANIPDRNGKEIVIAHLSDIHYDPLYLPGSLAECEEPMCCNRHFDIANGTDKAAGHWSDYRDCDTPWHMFVDAIEHMKETNPNMQYLYSSGDVIEHSVWTTSIKQNSESLTRIYKEMKRVFGDIPVYPCVGNHESHPLNVFAPDYITEEHLSTHWLYNLLADLWSVWLPESALETIRIGGYYTVVPQKGFRIISLNNNDCYSFNWWILHDPQYLSKQLQWLHDVLLEAEKAEEHVHIIAHVPSGVGSCLHTWSREYNRIIQRFTHTISGVFNGHTHSDEFHVFYSNTNHSHAINVAWNGGSLTTYSNKNPNYRIYHVEPETFQVVEHETWIFNLTEANMDPFSSPNWFLEYKFGEFYGLKNLSPHSLDGLLERFARNPKLLQHYWRFHKALADPLLRGNCDDNCMLSHLCDVATTEASRQDRCRELQQTLRETIEKGGGNGADMISRFSALVTITIVFVITLL